MKSAEIHSLVCFIHLCEFAAQRHEIARRYSVAGAVRSLAAMVGNGLISLSDGKTLFSLAPRGN